MTGNQNLSSSGYNTCSIAEEADNSTRQKVTEFYTSEASLQAAASETFASNILTSASHTSPTNHLPPTLARTLDVRADTTASETSAISSYYNTPPLLDRIAQPLGNDSELTSSDQTDQSLRCTTESSKPKIMMTFCKRQNNRSWQYTSNVKLDPRHSRKEQHKHFEEWKNLLSVRKQRLSNIKARRQLLQQATRAEKAQKSSNPVGDTESGLEREQWSSYSKQTHSSKCKSNLSSDICTDSVDLETPDTCIGVPTEGGRDHSFHKSVAQNNENARAVSPLILRQHTLRINGDESFEQTTQIWLPKEKQPDSSFDFKRTAFTYKPEDEKLKTMVGVIRNLTYPDNKNEQVYLEMRPCFVLLEDCMRKDMRCRSDLMTKTKTSRLYRNAQKLQSIPTEMRDQRCQNIKNGQDRLSRHYRKKPDHRQCGPKLGCKFAGQNGCRWSDSSTQQRYQIARRNARGMSSLRRQALARRRLRNIVVSFHKPHEALQQVNLLCDSKHTLPTSESNGVTQRPAVNGCHGGVSEDAPDPGSVIKPVQYTPETKKDASPSEDSVNANHFHEAPSAEKQSVAELSKPSLDRDVKASVETLQEKVPWNDQSNIGENLAVLTPQYIGSENNTVVVEESVPFVGMQLPSSDPAPTAPHDIEGRPNTCVSTQDDTCNLEDDTPGDTPAAEDDGSFSEKVYSSHCNTALELSGQPHPTKGPLEDWQGDVEEELVNDITNMTPDNPEDEGHVSLDATHPEVKCQNDPLKENASCLYFQRKHSRSEETIEDDLTIEERVSVPENVHQEPVLQDKSVEDSQQDYTLESSKMTNLTESQAEDSDLSVQIAHETPTTSENGNDVFHRDNSERSCEKRTVASECISHVSLPRVPCSPHEDLARKSVHEQSALSKQLDVHNEQEAPKRTCLFEEELTNTRAKPLSYICDPFLHLGETPAEETLPVAQTFQTSHKRTSTRNRKVKQCTSCKNCGLHTSQAKSTRPPFYKRKHKVQSPRAGGGTSSDSSFILGDGFNYTEIIKSCSVGLTDCLKSTSVMAWNQSSEKTKEGDIGIPQQFKNVPNVSLAPVYPCTNTNLPINSSTSNLYVDAGESTHAVDQRAEDTSQSLGEIPKRNSQSDCAIRSEASSTEGMLGDPGSGNTQLDGEHQMPVVGVIIAKRPSIIEEGSLSKQPIQDEYDTSSECGREMFAYMNRQLPDTMQLSGATSHQVLDINRSRLTVNNVDPSGKATGSHPTQGIVLTKLLHQEPSVEASETAAPETSIHIDSPNREIDETQRRRGYVYSSGYSDVPGPQVQPLGLDEGELRKQVYDVDAKELCQTQLGNAEEMLAVGECSDEGSGQQELLSGISKDGNSPGVLKSPGKSLLKVDFESYDPKVHFQSPPVVGECVLNNHVHVSSESEKGDFQKTCEFNVPGWTLEPDQPHNKWDHSIPSEDETVDYPKGERENSGNLSPEVEVSNFVNVSLSGVLTGDDIGKNCTLFDKALPVGSHQGDKVGDTEGYVKSCPKESDTDVAKETGLLQLHSESVWCTDEYQGKTRVYCQSDDMKMYSSFSPDHNNIINGGSSNGSVLAWESPEGKASSQVHNGCGTGENSSEISHQGYGPELGCQIRDQKYINLTCISQEGSVRSLGLLDDTEISHVETDVPGTPTGNPHVILCAQSTVTGASVPDRLLPAGVACGQSVIHQDCEGQARHRITTDVSSHTQEMHNTANKSQNFKTVKRKLEYDDDDDEEMPPLIPSAGRTRKRRPISSSLSIPVQCTIPPTKSQYLCQPDHPIKECRVILHDFVDTLVLYPHASSKREQGSTEPSDHTLKTNTSEVKVEEPSQSLPKQITENVDFPFETNVEGDWLNCKFTPTFSKTGQVVTPRWGVITTYENRKTSVGKDELLRKTSEVIPSRASNRGCPWKTGDLGGTKLHHATATRDQYFSGAPFQAKSHRLCHSIQSEKASDEKVPSLLAVKSKIRPVTDNGNSVTKADSRQPSINPTSSQTNGGNRCLLTDRILSTNWKSVVKNKPHQETVAHAPCSISNVNLTSNLAPVSNCRQMPLWDPQLAHKVVSTKIDLNGNAEKMYHSTAAKPDSPPHAPGWPTTNDTDSAPGGRAKQDAVEIRGRVPKPFCSGVQWRKAKQNNTILALLKRQSSDVEHELNRTPPVNKQETPVKATFTTQIRCLKHGKGSSGSVGEGSGGRPQWPNCTSDDKLGTFTGNPPTKRLKNTVIEGGESRPGMLTNDHIGRSLKECSVILYDVLKTNYHP